jgi:hypothetical protein
MNELKTEYNVFICEPLGSEKVTNNLSVPKMSASRESKKNRAKQAIKV